MQDLTKRAVILSAVPVTPALSAYLQPGDTVVACDAGYRNAAVLGIQPDLIVGDFDSAPKPETTGDMIILPHVKDDTDTHYAAKFVSRQAANIAKERLDVSFRVPAGWAAGRCIDSRRVLSIERCNADTGLPPWHQQ